MDDFVVADGGEGLGVPVHHAHAFVDPTFLIEVHEGVDHGFAQFGLHGEAGAVPVAGAAQLLELLQDDAAVLFFPLPGVLEEFLSADVFLGDAHALELGHHLGFGGDGGVVRTGDPAGVLAVHAGLTDEDIIEGIVEHVSHVKDTRHIRRRNHDGVRLFFIGFTVKELVCQPIGVPLVFHLFRTVLCS